jgi:hypothetical protein
MLATHHPLWDHRNLSHNHARKKNEPSKERKTKPKRTLDVGVYLGEKGGVTAHQWWCGEVKRNRGTSPVSRAGGGSNGTGRAASPLPASRGTSIAAQFACDTTRHAPPHTGEMNNQNKNKNK